MQLTRHLARARQPSVVSLDQEIAETRRYLRDKGLTLPDRPDGEMPRLPQDVTELSDAELMHLYRQMVAWAQYASSQAAIAEVAELRAERDLETARAAAIVAGKAKTATALKATAAEHPEVLAAQKKHTETYALRKLTAIIVASAEQDVRFLSRDLTRRTNIGDQSRRNDRWNT